MDVNNYRIPLNNASDKQLVIPIELKWDFTGQDQSIDLYEEDVVKEVIGSGYDFEINRFPHSADLETNKTEINYEFYFFSGGSISQRNNWGMSYGNAGFSNSDVYYYNNNFKNSFFKLDLYDTVDAKKQVNYITIIIPTTQGQTTQTTLNRRSVNIKKPKFTLDYIGDKEGFFLYWLRKLEFLNLNTFYMSAKFFNAGTGKFTRMMNQPQSTIIGNPYDFDNTNYFYYRVVCNYIDLNYSVYDINTNTRMGTTNPIVWFEYINPTVI